MNLKIREGNTNDYIAISNLIKEVHDLHVLNRPDVYLNVDNPFKKEQFEELLNSNNTNLFVVENTDNNELIGYSILQIMTTRNLNILIPLKFVYVDDFCIKSTYQKRGIDKMLFTHIVDYAKSNEASSIQLNVWDFNENAIKFYESLGMSTRNRRMELNI